MGAARRAEHAASAASATVHAAPAGPSSAGGGDLFDYGDCVMVDADADDDESLP